MRYGAIVKNRISTPAVKGRNFLLLATLLAALSFLTYGEISAQTVTPTPTATEDAGAVPNLSAQATARGVELSWEALPNAVRYELLTWWDLGTGWRPIAGDSLTATSYTHTSVVAGTEYYYSIRAIYADGEGPWLSSDYPNAVALATTGDGTPSPTPTATATAAAGTPTATPTPTATADAGDVPKLSAQATTRGVELSWEALPNAVRYELLTWWDLGTGWRPIGGDNLTGTSYTHTSAVAGTEYYYSIRAIYADGEGPWLSSDYPTAVALATTGDGTATPTPTATATPTPTATPAVGTPTPTPTSTTAASAGVVPDLTAQATTRGVELSWEALPNAVRYELLTYWASDPGWQPIGGGNLTTTSYTHTSVTAGTRYYYSIRAVYAGGEGPWLSSDYPTAIALAVGTATPPPAIATNERDALIALYEATDGANWKNSDNWLTDKPLDSWYGVSTDGSGKVTELDLSRNELNGLVPDLSALTNLMKLDLSRNRLRRNISGLSRLTNLTELDVSYNFLTETLPNLSMLGNLTELNAGRNTIRGQIPDLSALTSLRVLNLRYNLLSGPIPRLSGLSELAYLSLRNNDLSGPIPDLGALTGLRSLVLSDNELSGNIPDLSALTNLVVLHLNENELSGPIPDLSALVNLEALNLSYNELSGPIPDLSALSRLTSLDLGGNDLSGPIPDLSALTDLRTLSLQYNQLSGPIPDLSALSRLTSLVLSRNELSGPIPDVSRLTKLEYLRLGLNGLSGGIPDLGDLTELKSLGLGHNQLTGTIVELGALTELHSLNLAHNQFTGPVPDLSALPNLASLSLMSNQLCIPAGADFSALTKLHSLNLAHNQFTGPVPDLSALPNLKSLSLMSNQLCIPAGADFSGSHEYVKVELSRANLPTCTDADLKLVPGVPGNFSATVDGGQVTLTWDAAANAASYDLRVWDSLNREWGSIAGDLTGGSFLHAVLTDGRNYYYQIRARHDNGTRGVWSEQLYVAVVEPQFPPPPKVLGLDMLYQKYLDVAGVGVSGPSEISDEKFIQAREIITGMLSARPDVLATLAANGTRVAIYWRTRDFSGGGLGQLPEFRGRFAFFYPVGAVIQTASGWLVGVPNRDTRCYVFIHEFAHAVQYALEKQPDGQEFISRLKALYDAAIGAGLWEGEYAATNYAEYWAEVVTYWFEESLPTTLAADFPKLADYDAEAAKLVEEVFGDATVPEYCKR